VERIQTLTLDEFSDDILVAASRHGDRSAYAILVKRHYRYVYAVCLGIVGNVHDAEDIAQDAMIKGFLKIRRLKVNEQFDPWILRIAKNLCFDFVRRRKRIKTFPVARAAELPEPKSENYDLQEAIERLPREHRLPLMMYYFDNKNAKTIAEKLRISHSGACRRIRAAREHLHKLLSERAYDE
jgi:RNA polymerase sigma-70 factor (ECF subfamily)